MSKKKMTALDVIVREERVHLRAAARAAAAAKVQALRDWRRERAEAAQVRAAAEAAARRKSSSRGVDRVPARLSGLAVTPQPYIPVPDEDGVTPQVDSTLGTSVIHGRRITASYADRRAQGARGHRRKPRRRDMPGATERRIERNRNAAQSLWA